MKSNLLYQLRQQLAETTSTATMCSFYGGSTRRRHRKQDAIDRLVTKASKDEDLHEAIIMLLEARAHIRFTGSGNHVVYRSVLRSLEESLSNIDSRGLYALYNRLTPLLETASSEPAASQDVHNKFIKALEKKFSVEALSHTPINDGVFVHFDEEDSLELASVINEVREFSTSHKYLVMRKGTFSSGNDKTWVFVVNPSEPIKDV